MSRVVKIDDYVKKEGKKTRVAAYARVSTDNAEQLASLEAQKQYYDSYIKSHKDWEYAGLFYDEGVSGTKTDKREGLLRMLDECRKGSIDFIIVKSISRLARNTVDCLEIVRELYDLGIYLYFEKENINTSKMQSELLLTILSSIAESESKSISKNEKWSIQKRFENGEFVIGYPPYGYKNVNGKMEIVPEEAETVRWMFREYLGGSGCNKIAKALNEKGIPTKKSGHWSSSTVAGIIKNEKYTGDVIYQKSYTDDRFNRHRNNGEMEKYFVKDHHEAIISHEDFEAAKELMAHHGRSKSIKADSDKYLNRYPFSGKIICGACGSTWKRRTHYTKSQGEYYAYVCEKHIEDKDSCRAKYIREEDIKAAFCNVMNKLAFAREEILRPVIAELKSSAPGNESERLQEITRLLEGSVNQRTQLMNLFMKQYLDSEAYNEENSVLLKQEAELNAEREKILKAEGGGAGRLELFEALNRHLARNKVMTEFSDEAFEKFIDRIVAESREELIFHFKCGLKLKERL